MFGYVFELDGLDSWLEEQDRFSDVVERFKANHETAIIDTQVLIGPHRDEVYFLIKIDEQGDTEEDEQRYWI